MSRTRHAGSVEAVRAARAEVCPPLPDAVTALSLDLPRGQRIPPHLHPEDQLVYAVRGVMTVRTEAGTWVVPPRRAVFIPAGVAHAVETSGAVSMRTVYLRPSLTRRLPRRCRVVDVSPLVRELLLEACRRGKLSVRRKRDAHLVETLLDQLRTVQASPLDLAQPTDARAVRVADRLAADPGGRTSLEAVCRTAGASKRTIERLFRAETRMSLGAWRQQLRLVSSLRSLAQGRTVTESALEAGYATPSAFIAMFRCALGTTPRRYFAAGS